MYTVLYSEAKVQSRVSLAGRTPGSLSPPETRREEINSHKERRLTGRSIGSRNDWNARATIATSAGTSVSSSGSSLAELFGYFEDSDNNTLALIRSLGLGEDDSRHSSSSLALDPEVAEEVYRNIERIPDRGVLDFLVQYFVAEVHWVDQLVYLPWFLAKYKRWWMVERVTLVLEVDFAVLILRICFYASQFLPSPGYTLDNIRGVLLADIRSICDEIAANLSAISRALDSRGSLIRVQHLAFSGLSCQIEGRSNAFWEALSRAIQAAQSVGIHSETARTRQGVDEIDKEMERRTFCNLYTWDSLLSRQLDRIALFPGCLIAGNWPEMHLKDADENGESDAPDPFTERLLQARLADFWRGIGSMQSSEYNIVVAEERYDKFCREYLSKLPPTFALKPNKDLDSRFPKLPLQRELLHIAIYDSLCWNFRPLLLRKPLAQSLPPYKRVLLISQKKGLAVAALHVLESVKQLHAMLGGCHTRFTRLIFSTFEAAVLLVYLCIDPMFPEECHDITRLDADSTKMDPLLEKINCVTRLMCVKAVQGALDRLRMLAEVSNMADVAANTLTQLAKKTSALGSVASIEPETEHSPSKRTQELVPVTASPFLLAGTSPVASWLSFGSSDSRSLDDFISRSTTSTIGDMTSWSFLDPSNVSLRDDLDLTATNDLQNNWGTQGLPNQWATSMLGSGGILDRDC
ncbi:hypothetical protein EYC80_009906 [Monilinia laxa]|uniref:Xylanolytic transcriptional activator regulatory domain-containing protein n=1 Tax=Monilinia laxa TaxID=61186 RepID=A0A5N6JRP7_MONLA|nr:hypothetical protein EYC80_009906 [Monilinia laxa]